MSSTQAVNSASATGVPNIFNTSVKSKPLYVALFILGVIGSSLAILGAHQVLWSAGTLSHLEQINAIRMMCTGGAILSIVTWMAASIKNYINYAAELYQTNSEHAAELESIEKDHRRLEKKCAKLHQDISRLNSEHAAELESIEKDHQRLEKECAKLHQDISRLNSEHAAELESIEKAGRLLLDDHRRLEKKCAKLHQDISRLNSEHAAELESIEKAGRLLLNDHQRLEKECAKLHQDISRLKSEHEQLKSEHEQRKNKLNQQLQQKRTQLESLEKENAELRQSINQLNSKHEQKVSELQQKNNLLETALTWANKENITENTSWMFLKTSLQEKLEKELESILSNLDLESLEREKKEQLGQKVATTLAKHKSISNAWEVFNVRNTGPFSETAIKKQITKDLGRTEGSQFELIITSPVDNYDALKESLLAHPLIQRDTEKALKILFSCHQGVAFPVEQAIKSALLNTTEGMDVLFRLSGGKRENGRAPQQYKLNLSEDDKITLDFFHSYRLLPAHADSAPILYATFNTTIHIVYEKGEDGNLHSKGQMYWFIKDALKSVDN